jgi:hypothetical protein
MDLIILQTINIRLDKSGMCVAGSAWIESESIFIGFDNGSNRCNKGNLGNNKNKEVPKTWVWL